METGALGIIYISVCLGLSGRDETVCLVHSHGFVPPLVDQTTDQTLKVKTHLLPRMASPFLVAVLAVVAILVPATRTAPVAPIFRMPRHSIPQQIEAGARSFHSIERAARSESIFDRFWGTDCFSKALQEFSSECRDLLPAQKARLAFKLARCQLIVQGEDDEREGRLRCSQSTLLKTCLAAFNSREYSLYVELLSSIDVTCLFLQNLSFEANAERVLNGRCLCPSLPRSLAPSLPRNHSLKPADLVTHGVRNSGLVSKLSLELEIMLGMISKQNANATKSTATFVAQVNAMHEAVAKTAFDVVELFELIKSDAIEFQRLHADIKTDISALIELQQTTGETLRGIAADVTWQDATFYASALLLLVLSNSVGVPAKMRGLYFTWLVSILALERAFSLTSVSKTQLRKAVGAVVLAVWFAAEWHLRNKRIRAQPAAACHLASPKSADKGGFGKPVRRSPRVRRSRSSLLDPS